MTAINNDPGKSGSAKKSSGAKSSSPASEPVLDPDLLTFTIQARTGQIVKIESVDSTGAHHELSDEEKSNLAKEKSKTTLEDMLEQAFEAGMACVLGDADASEKLSWPEKPPSKSRSNSYCLANQRLSQ